MQHQINKEALRNLGETPRVSTPGAVYSKHKMQNLIEHNKAVMITPAATTGGSNGRNNKDNDYCDKSCSALLL